jgi:hypothetical protein
MGVILGVGGLKAASGMYPGIALIIAAAFYRVKRLDFSAGRPYALNEHG